MKAQEAKQTIDGCGASLTFFHILRAVALRPDGSDGAEFDWRGITLISHPIQKAMFNANTLLIRQDEDALGVLKRFWKGVRWRTDLDFPRDKVEVRTGEETPVEIINLWYLRS